MMDQPPEPPQPFERAIEAPVESGLPSIERDDGSVVIDLMPLAPPPTECADALEEPDPFNPEILVCRETVLSPRLGEDYGPTADELIEGSAVPRARLRLSEETEAQANLINKGVGNWNANGAEARIKIDF